jgi:hypothetical protein
MATNTMILVKGPITIEEIYNFFKEKIDPSAELRYEIYLERTGNNKSSVSNKKIESGYIYYNKNEISYLSTASHIDFTDLPMDSIQILFSCTDENVVLAICIAKQFGGYVKENTDSKTKMHYISKEKDYE